MSDGTLSRFQRFVYVMFLVAELIGPAFVGALAAILLAFESPWWLILLVAVTAALAIPLEDMRARKRAVDDALAGAERRATVGDVARVSAELSADYAELICEVRVLRAEVAELRRPWWRRVVRRAR